ncbi:MAG TPA: LPS export ABC transporter periplasmic protein LptC, partial [Acidobacteriota bacterium]
MSTTNILRRFRILKWVPRILLLGVIAFSAYVYFHYDQGTKEPPANPDAGRGRVVTDTNLVDFTQMDSGIPIYHVTAKRRKQFKSSAQELDDPEFTFFDKEGAETIRVKGKSCKISKEINMITVMGGAVVRSANGMKVEAEQMRYDSREQHFSTDDPAHFRWQSMQGWSKGFIYEIETQTLILPQNPEIRYVNKDSENKKPIVMIGDRGRVERLNGFAYFEGNVVVTQGPDKVKADRIETYFEPGGNTVQKITAMNNVTVKFGRPGRQDDVPARPAAEVPAERQAPGMGNVFSADASSGKELEAQLVELYFYEDGATIQSFHAEENCTFVLHTYGKNNKPVENRIIKGEIFDAKFNTLSDMEEFHAMENVSVKLQPLHKKETHQPSQTIFCNDLVATFVPQTGDVKEIHFNDGFKHVQEQRTVTSERAVYSGNLKKTDLIGNPEINDASFKIQSKDMELFEETSGIH